MLQAEAEEAGGDGGTDGRGVDGDEHRVGDRAGRGAREENDGRQVAEAEHPCHDHCQQLHGERWRGGRRKGADDAGMST